MGSNQRPANSNNAPHNSMAMQQQQPQLGMAFPQNSVPFSNQNAYTNNNGQAMGMPNMPVNQNGFMNHPNQLLQLQNSILGMAQLAMINPAQFNMGGFNALPNLNQPAAFPAHAQFGNSPRPPGQFYGQNFPRLPQQMNQNTGLPNGQFGFQNAMQNMNQFMPVLGSNYNMFGGANQQAQATVGPQNPPGQIMGPQNPTFFPNPQFGQVNQNQQNLVPPAMDVNVLLAAATQLLQGNSSAPLCSSTAQLQQNQNIPPAPFTGSSQENAVTNGQSNTNWNNSPNGRTNNWKNSPNGKFTRNPKGEASQMGFQKSQFHHMKNMKRNFGSPNEQKGQGMKNARAGKFGLPNTANQQKRSLALTYTEQEIQQWREERRKNHPSKTNLEKKLAEKTTDPNAIDREAKLRRERLKEVLAKQAELGVEVAEIPSYYLSDSEKQVHGKDENRGPSTKKGRFQNKHDKRGRFNKKDRFAKRQKLNDADSSNIRPLEKKPTLLQKLLSADIKRDKNHLLQVFRFMAMNSYFKDWPEKPLKFPLVLVKENGPEVEVGNMNSSLVGNDTSEGQEKTMAENSGNNVECSKDLDDDDDENENENDDDIDCVDGNDNDGNEEEEEGEIID